MDDEQIRQQKDSEMLRMVLKEAMKKPICGTPKLKKEKRLKRAQGVFVPDDTCGVKR